MKKAQLGSIISMDSTLKLINTSKSNGHDLCLVNGQQLFWKAATS